MDKKGIYLITGIVATVLFWIFRVEVYEGLYQVPGYSDAMYNTGIYGIVGIISAAMAWGAAAIFYYAINSVRFARWWHWLSILAIVSILAPIVILLCYRRKNFLLFTVTSVAALAQLYLMGTRLAFFSIAVAALGVPVVLVLTGKARASKRYIAVLVLILAVCCATYKQSPMYINQNRYNEAMSYNQNDANVMIKRAEGNKDGTSTVTPEERYHALCTIYNFYSPNMCRRFGTARVMSAYGYSDQVTDITATRHRKIVFCEMLLDEQPFTSRLFGMELGRMAFDGEIYDVENDFHGICFLYGWVGLAMMVAFIGYFLYLIVKCLIKDFRKYFTVEAGAFGIGLCLCLVYAYFTAGVLRRPNASIYMSVLLAVVYYLTQMRSEQPDALPDGEEKRA